MLRTRPAMATTCANLAGDQVPILAPEPVERFDARTLVLRQRAGVAGPGWELWLRTPAPALADLVVGLWAGDSDAPSAHHRVLPNGELSVMFNLGPPQRVVRDDGAKGEVHARALVTGLQTSPLAFDSIVKHPRAVCVRLRPLGAFTFFGGLPLLELTERVVDLDAVMGRLVGVEPLRQRLAEAPDLGTALDLLEEWLTARLLAGPGAHPVTRAAVHSLHAGAGDIRITSLARDLGVSSKRLNGLFHREVGVSAKSLARILRFERALERLAASGGDDLADLAYDCGYYDQPHMNRDFRELAGLTPTEYLAHLFQAPGWREVRG